MEQATIFGKFGLPEPKAGGKMLRPMRDAAPATDLTGPSSKIKGNPAILKGGQALPGQTAQLQAEGPVAGKKQGGSAVDALTDRMADEAAPAMAAMLDQIEAMLAAATSLDELRAMLLEGYPDLDADALADVLAMGLLSAQGAGRAAAAASDTDAEPGA